MMDITWDDRKELQNIKSHGYDFSEASTVILNPLSLYRQNLHPGGKRWEYIGHSDRSNLLFVVTVEEFDDAAHILSARKAEQHERKEYEEGLSY